MARQCYVIVRRDDDPTAPAVSEQSVLDLADAGDGRDTMLDALAEAYATASGLADEYDRAYAITVLVPVDPERRARWQRLVEQQQQLRQRKLAGEL